MPRVAQYVLTHRYSRHAGNVLRGWMEHPELLRRFLRESQLGQALLCVPLGLGVGALTVLLHHVVLFAHRYFFQLSGATHLSASQGISSARIFLVPMLGGATLGALTILLRRWRSRDIVDPIEANAILGGRMSFTDNLRLLAESLVSNAAGASVGMEAAYTQMGAGVLSWAGQRLQLRREDVRIFVAAGAGAAIAAAFNAPLAGAFYGFELVLSSYTIAALSPVAVCALSSAVFVRLFTNDEPIFSLPINISDIPSWNYPLYFVMGIGAALIGIATMKMVTKCEQLCTRLLVKEWLRPAIGGFFLALLALFSPQVLGSGQGAIDMHLHEHWSLYVLGLLLLAKMAGSAVSIGMGFRGGMFSSSLLLGCLFGQMCSIVAEAILPQMVGQAEVFMLVGIGAVAASIVGAPITMVLLVLEMTGNFQATTAVLLGVLVASAITRYFFGYSFSTWRFHLRGLRIQSAQDIGWIRELTVDQLMRSDASTVRNTMELSELRKFVPLGSAKRIFVVDAREEYSGVIDINALHNPDLDPKIDTLTARDLAQGQQYYLLPQQDIREILQQFEDSALEELPVLHAIENPKVIGYMTESYALRRYAQELEYRNLGHHPTHSSGTKTVTL